MGDTEFYLACLRDPRLAAHTASAYPAWLWSIDGTRTLWANAIGAALLGVKNPVELNARTFAEGDAIQAQIERLGASCGEKPRLERLRGFGNSVGRLLTCACSRFTLGDQAAILVVATEHAGPELSLRERVQRLHTAAQAPAAPRSADSPSPDTEAIRAASAATGRTDLAPSPAVAPEPSAKATRALERRHPLRFVWQMEGNGRFTISSEEFARLIGPNSAAVLGQSWSAIASELALDPDGQVAQAAASQDTWSGITVAWPVDGTSERLRIELSGLPVFDRQRSFRGYRGFGVCRDLARLAALAQERAAAPEATREKAASRIQAGAPPADHALPAPTETSAPPPAGSAAEGRPFLTIVPPAKNVVPFRTAGSDARSPILNPVERKVFRELTQQLTARLATASENEQMPLAEGDAGLARATETAPPDRALHDIPPQATEPAIEKGHPEAVAQVAGPAQLAGRVELERPREASILTETRTVLDKIPAGVLIYRLNDLLYANRAFLDWAGYHDIGALAAAGGLDSLLVEASRARQAADGGSKALALTSGRSNQAPAEARLSTVTWDDEPALMLTIAAPGADDRRRAGEQTWRDAQAKLREREAMLERATDAIVLLDGAGSILASNASAQALFGHDAPAMLRRSFTDLLVPESHRVAHDCLDALMRESNPDIAEPAHEMIGRRSGGEPIPLSMSLHRFAESPPKLCAVFRDLTPWKKAEEERLNAKRQAERAASAQADVLAKISHEVRTPLNAIIGFCEVMIAERFGPVGNDRYLEYLKDIRTSGGQLVALINDLLDLSKIESGKLELSVAPLALNELTQQCVAIMQQRANRGRIIIRTSLATKLPRVLADARSIRQVVINVLANSIELTNAGGQVIVSTALSDTGDVVLRIRDSGIGMSEIDLKAALEPFRQHATSQRVGPTGTGLGLPLAKALAEANRASFAMTSAINAGTFVEVTFPSTQVLAE
jgi:PAS domain S-box-containing protein